MPQIWAGTDQCEPVTWQECELIEKDVQFIVPDVTCSNKLIKHLRATASRAVTLWGTRPEDASLITLSNAGGVGSK